MNETVMLIKNMVCHRCILSVEDILRSLNTEFTKVQIGEVHLPCPLTPSKKEEFSRRLGAIGFELIDTHAGALIEKIKALVIKKARNEVEENEMKVKLSNYLTKHLHYEYTYLSSLFSSVEGRTIENFFIEQRIEKAKELLVYGQKTLSEIAWELDYSSVAHLSGQFKKITGLTPSHFKQVGNTMRRPLDHI